ncbi:outer membrane protein assembly factor BamA [Ancylobacter sp. SL191]|uniref:outer membrane protein assembly factor BamA n=1 Tax=Ancylobacter sp. SL191 TaxID=2995166 RepID=UPI0022704484|nr:outer membrane protein assembly factor BamA [Ancylobacter sp. SL191]WAC29085.1 outer membrane protein assembly factor BamA [Ancylobacter sp. SL191]
MTCNDQGLGARLIHALLIILVAVLFYTIGDAAQARLYAAAGPTQEASSIVVEGNQRVDSETIRSYFASKPGEALTPAKIDEGLKALYATGLFSDVNVSRSGNRLVVRVTENEVINRVAFEGNRKIKDEQLASEVQSKARAPFSKTTVQADTQRIIELYRRSGRYDVKVVPKTIERGQGRVDLVFEITEGEKLGVAGIVFVGNKAFSEYKLKEELTTTETNWLSWIKNTDVYDVDRINSDQELLRRFYLRHGYADFRIVSVTADLDRGKNGFILTYVIDEGPQYRVGTVDVVSNIKDVDPARIRAALRVQKGQVYNAELVEKSVENATIEVSKSGYAFAQVRPRGDRDVQTRTISLVFAVEEGPRVYIERIEIRGNTRTRDWVIRREFDLAEGDAYNRVLIDRAERRLRNLGYFKDVKITNEPGTAPDRVVLVVQVEDQPTGEFSISGGYSTSDGFIGEVAVSEKNFLGRGQYVRIAGSLGEDTQGLDFNFTEPYFLDSRVAAGFDLYWKETTATSTSPYDTSTVGGTLRAALPLTDEFTLGLRYSLYQKEITIDEDTIEDYGTPSWALLEVNGDPAITSAIGYTLTYNMLDNNNGPSNGYLLEFKQDMAGLGGDVNYIRSTFDSRFYFPVYGDVTFMVRGQGGNIASWGGEDLRILDNFFKGPDLVRGFKSNGIGPRDLASGCSDGVCDSSDADALGGTVYWGASAEMQFPLTFMPKEMGLTAAVFADAGSMWDYQGGTTFENVSGWQDSLTDCSAIAGSKTKGYNNVCVADSDSIRSSVGVSLIWKSPFGPLRFDYAWVLTKEDYDQTQAFRFSGGTKF